MTTAPARSPGAPTRRGSRRVSFRPPGLPASARISPRTTIIGVLAALLAVAVAGWSMSLGSFTIPFPTVLGATFGIGDVPASDEFIVQTLRLPRALTALLVGAALAASGAIFQGLVRNPLVAPDIIGVTSGASLVAVFIIVVTGATALLPIGAFAGAILTSFAVYVLTWRRGISGNRLVLVGIGVSALLTALTTFLTVRFPIEQVSSAVQWQSGTLYLSTWDNVLVLAFGVGVLLPAALWLSRRLSVLQLGDDAARSLGVRAEASRAGLLVVGAALAALAVSAGGPIGFVALITPHIARMLAGPFTGGVLALSAVLGATLLAASDLVAQHMLAPLTLPVGVVTAALGAPYFLFLLYRTNKVL